MTDASTCDTPGRVTRTKLFPIRITLPLTKEMLARADAALAEGETRLELIREGIEREIKRRERAKP